MQSVLSAKTAILVHFQSVRIIFLVLFGIVVSLFALTADQCYFDSQCSAPPDEFETVARSISLPPSNKRRLFLGTKIEAPFAEVVIVYHKVQALSRLF